MNAATFAGEYDVAIVGLGPTGLTLAHLLGLRGLRVLALEREPEFYGAARAVYTDDECMRVFQAAGVASELEADMLVDTTVQWVLKDGSVLSQLRRTDKPYGWAVSNFFYQPYLEAKMERLLERHPNVTALRGREVVGFSQDATGVTIEHAASSGTRYGQANPNATPPAQIARTRAQWLVACDGGRSGVRARLGIKMAGKSFPEPWLVVDVKAKEGEDCFRHMPYFNFHCDPKQPTVSCPQPGGHHRFEFLLMPGQTKEDMEDAATVRRLLAPYVDVDKVEVLRQLVYTFNALVAERWRDGRVLLAGDAAHMTPQFMGQGMSSGVRDAHNLAWKFEAVLRKGADPKLIDTYESERKPHAKEMIDISVKMKDFVSLANPVLAGVRNLVVRTLLATPKVGDYFREARFKPPPTYPNGAYFGLRRKRRNSAEGRPFRSRRCAPTTDVGRCSTTSSARISRSSAMPATRARVSTPTVSRNSWRSASGSLRSIPSADARKAAPSAAALRGAPLWKWRILAVKRSRGSARPEGGPAMWPSSARTSSSVR